ncbi:MAG: glycosyltransferase [Candidatus Riflebacteria bacterium]|nr:glycosyltransferase [Candidatus Riflebacteria bacterium]
MKKSVLLFPHSYPFRNGEEGPFIEPEIPFLLDNFQLKIIPLRNKGNRKSGIKDLIVDESLSEAIDRKGYRNWKDPKAFVNPIFWKELLRKTPLLTAWTFKRLLGHISSAQIVRAWIEEKISKLEIDVNNSIFYTYWFDIATTGISMVKRQQGNRNLFLVTRLHGYDLYYEQNSFSYIPMRSWNIPFLNAFFFVSQVGRKFFLQYFPKEESKCFFAPLGMPDYKIQSQPSSDGVFRIVSCSYFAPVKRVSLIIEVLKLLEKMDPGQNYFWYHIGDGLQMNECKSLAEKCFTGRVKFKFLGYLPRKDIFDYYGNNKLDLFITLSESEGRPVSVVEAISVGLPVLATSVGGTPEIVNEKNGILVEKNVSPAKVALEILRLRQDKNKLLQMRKESRKIWLATSTTDNSSQFVTFLKQLENKAHS